ncbi:ABC transporter substrate-binding protein [Oceanimonas baumannii]|uniref:Arginine/ornithine transport system substrate-binding protein n=1 Tax=Oceanimonas baumannii TaxID=129578 RepID=A0A235CMS0_9GAMM|nr:ABC transporter substrate-binding protein [Oceanimonas baumannii]OYD25852.1 nickel transporter [Oceanimonas baumannii]TDW60132.1 arginine/ornithine transport system substrate-binding protein [Oceanimonas baumannii]
MKKLWIAGAVMAALATGAVQAKEWKTVRFGIEGAYPPFSWTDENGELQGFDVDMANALCEQMQVKCQLVAQDWDGIIPALLARKYDAIIAAMSITEERKRTVDFTGKYALVPNKFVAAKGTEFELSVEGLAGKKIGVQIATTHDKYLTENFGDEVGLVRYGNADDAYLDLKAGRVDYVFLDATAIEEGLLNKEGGDAFEFVGPSVTDEKWFGEGFGIAVRKQDKDLKAMLDQAILDLRESGKYQEVNNKYFDYDVYGK